MHPIFQLFGVRNLNEEQTLFPVGRVNHAFLISHSIRILRVFVEIQNFSPENGLGQRIQTVKSRVRNECNHGVQRSFPLRDRPRKNHLENRVA